MPRVRVPGDGPKCWCGALATFGGYCNAHYNTDTGEKIDPPRGGDGSRAIDIQDGYHGVRVGENAALSASPIACEMADMVVHARGWDCLPRQMMSLFDRIETATRNSPFRKVRP